MTNTEVFKYDDVLEEIGGFNRYQKLILLVITVTTAARALIASEFIFATASIPYRCRIPECDGPGLEAEYRPPWLDKVIPQSNNKYESCQRYVLSDNMTETHIVSPNSSAHCPSYWFDKGNTEPCIDGYVFEKNNTIVYDFHLECQEWKRVAVGSYRNIGMMFGVFFSGILSDRYGRKTATLICVFNQIVCASIRYFSVNYEMYVVIHFIDSTLAVGVYNTGMILASEMVTPKWRSIIVTIIMSSITLGNMASAAIAWLVQYWRTYIIVVLCVQALQLLIIWKIDESVRWLINKGQFDRARKIIDKISTINSKPMTPETKDKLNMLLSKNNYEDSKTLKLKTTVSYKDIIRSQLARRLIFTIPLWWLITKFVSYGLSLNSITLNGNMYINFMLVYLTEIPGYLTSTYLLQNIGRKKSLCFANMICGLCCFSYIIMPSDWFGASLALYCLGKYFISIVEASLYTYTSELFPTQYRHAFLGFSIGVSKISAALSPLTPALMIYWTHLPLLIFGIVAILSCFLINFAPETKNTKLPENIEQLEDLK